MFNIEKVDHFPEITRNGRASAELQMIIDALRASAENSERFCITGIEPGNAYNSMQQRIRTQAKKLDLKVAIRFDALEQRLYFRAFDDSGDPESELAVASVKASTAKGVRSRKTSTDSE